jgi:hypothetical protein
MSHVNLNSEYLYQLSCFKDSAEAIFEVRGDSKRLIVYLVYPDGSVHEVWSPEMAMEPHFVNEGDVF